MTTENGPASPAPPDLGRPDQTGRAGGADQDKAAPEQSRLPLLGRLWRGRPEDPVWVRPVLICLLVATALLYLVGLGSSGWANAFYSAAVQAATQSWKAFFFGSSDGANFITVDKPPASLWVMGLSARLFGVNAWSILVPQALMGVAAVGVLYVTLRRWFGPVAGLIAGAVLAFTPAAALMFRFNNPDALLVLLLVLSAWATVRAVERGGARWLMLAATFVGFAFLTKMLQAFFVVPVFVLVYMVAAPIGVRRRLWHLVLAGVALVVSSGWWVAVVELWPTSSRPYIGGSQTNSIVELIFGYNGLGRITGNEVGSVVAGGAGRAGMWGATGWDRMFTASWGGQIAWLLPAALAFMVALLWLTRGAPRTDRLRASTLLWGGWLVVTAGVFSFAQGIIHEYYAVALGPAIGALVGMGAVALWQHRSQIAWRFTLAGVLAMTSVWSYVLLSRSADWQPWLRPLVLAAGLTAAALLAVGGRLGRRATPALAVAGILVALAGPAAYSLQTASTAHAGSLPTAGPAVAGTRGGGFGRGGRGNGGFGGPGGMTPPQTANGTQGAFGGQGAPPGMQDGGTGGMGGPGMPGGTQDGSTGSTDGMGGPGGFGGGNTGGLLDASTPSAELVALLETDADQYTWVAATVGAQSAAGYQLATDLPVMSLGGFNGSDPYPSLAQFQAFVNAGRVHYFIAGGMGGGGQGGASGMSEITSWVSSNYRSTTVGGITVYDLSSPTGTSVDGVTNGTGTI
jgi:4-amino-4-deoxy-L-arabinose transferase-like glycosyltransferase